MNADYPGNLLAREPPPPYEGEGPFALWPFWQQVVESAVGFSGSRLRNAGPHPQMFSSPRPGGR
jgi:hypothetical protein